MVYRYFIYYIYNTHTHNSISFDADSVFFSSSFFHQMSVHNDPTNKEWADGFQQTACNTPRHHRRENKHSIIVSVSYKEDPKQPFKVGMTAPILQLRIVWLRGEGTTQGCSQLRHLLPDTCSASSTCSSTCFRPHCSYHIGE